MSVAVAATSASAGTGTGWIGYLNGPQHTSYAAGETAITPATVPALVQKWHFAGNPPTMRGQPGNKYYASPAVAGGAVFIGSDTGWFYKLNAATGQLLGKVFLGFQPAKTCGAAGVVDTATVAVDPSDSQPAVYVGGPNGYLYALRASDLSVKWKSLMVIPSKTISNYFDWSSPTVAFGRVYIGVASGCDNPLIRGAVFGYDQVTGKKFAQFYTVPRGDVGGSVWSSAAVAADGYVYVTTGNGPYHAPETGYSESIIKLSPRTLAPAGRFRVPASQVSDDGDFGASPTIFGSFVGACDKNGIFYALRRSTMALVWRRRVGGKSAVTNDMQCLSAAVFDGRHLFFAAAGVRINGKAYLGSVQETQPDGKLVWATGLPATVIGSPSKDGGGVVAVGTWLGTQAPNAVYLINASSGRILRVLVKGSPNFAQSVFAGGWLFTANDRGVYGWAPG